MNTILFILNVEQKLRIFDELEDAMREFKITLAKKGTSTLHQAIKKNGGGWVTTLLTSATNGKID